MDISEILNHLGEDRNSYFKAVSPPIIQSSNFVFDSIDDLRTKIQDELSHHIYTRGNNPTVEILRKKVAALEKSEDCLVVGSGAAAVAAAIISQIKAGDHIICVSKPYSWTNKLISSFLPRFDIEYTFVNGEDIEEIMKATKENTTLLMLESPNSLTFEIQDLKACADFAKSRNIITVIDNSHCSPYFQNPIDFGIDIVIHSATKYICGHSDVVMGVICSSKKIIQQIFSSELMTLGMTVSPNDAFLAIRGLRTFQLRMERVEASGKVIFDYLKAHNKVRKIYYPLDPDSTQYELAKKQMRGCGGLISIELDTDSKSKVNEFVDALDKFLYAVSWGGHESLKMPTLAFHDIPGIPDSPIPFQTIRLYVGLEDPTYLIKNIEEAFTKI